MAHERHVHRTVLSASTPSAKRVQRIGVTRGRREDRRFDALDPNAPLPLPPPRTALLWIPLVVVALLVTAFARSLLVRTLLPLALAVVAVVLLMQRARNKDRARRERIARRGLLLRDHDLRFKPGAGDLARAVLDRQKPFGATLVSTHRRDRLVLMLTSDTGVFHVGTTASAASLPVLATLLEHATTLAGEDAAFDAIGPDGEPVLLAPDDFVALVDELSLDDPACLDRVFVTDTKGGRIELSDGELRVDGFAFDLNAPLEWRALVFQEPFGQVMTLYQGTWIRQGGSEVVLVSLLPSLGPILEVEPGEIALLDRAVLRDLRLMQASAETPPPREQRHAIERLLMMPIRSILDRAPRKLRQPAPQRPPLH